VQSKRLSLSNGIRETPSCRATDAAEASFVWEMLSVTSHANHGLLERLTRGESLNYLPGSGSRDSDQTSCANEQGPGRTNCF